MPDESMGQRGLIEALRKSEERFRLAAHAGQMFAYEWDAATDVITRSGECAHILGVDEATPITGKEVISQVHPEDRERLIAAMAKLNPREPNLQISYRMVRPDGRVIWVERTSRAQFDGQGGVRRIIGMITDVTERKLAEERLREYEKAVEGLEEALVVVDRDYRYLIANRKFLNVRGKTKNQVEGRLAKDVLNKGVFEGVIKEKLDECFQGKVVRFEMKYTYPDLGERDLLVSYFPIQGKTGIERVACILQDITDRKKLEHTLSGMSRKLIELQEQGRAQIARELHDDISQRLTLLAIRMSSLTRNLPASPAKVKKEIGQAHKEAENLASDVQALSHRLHSSKLEYLGLEGAAASLCRELSDRQNVKIAFHSERVPKEVPKDVSICLFRVLQEALQNAIKHSGAARFEVSLRGGPGEIQLIVRDSGVGFRPKDAMRGDGLGLASMSERLRLVGGEFSIESQPHLGTAVRARVPVSSRAKSARAGQ